MSMYTPLISREITVRTDVLFYVQEYVLVIISGNKYMT